MPRTQGPASRAPDQAPHPAEARLGAALADALRIRRAGPALRDAIGEYVVHARHQRLSWGDTLAAVRELMREAAAGQVVTAESDALAESVLGWCEEEYAQGP